MSANWTINSDVKVTVDNEDRSEAVVANTLYIREQIGNFATLASFELIDPKNEWMPTGWDEVKVTVTKDGAPSHIFGGFVVETAVSAVDTGSGTRYAVECKDYSVLLDQVTVNKVYARYVLQGGWAVWTAEQVLEDLFNVYMIEDGVAIFNTENVVGARVVEGIEFENVTLRVALNKLALQVGADWLIDGQKNVLWFDPAEPADAAFEISNEPDFDDSFPPLRGSVSKTIDDLNVVNSVTVIGGYNEEQKTEVITFSESNIAQSYTLEHIPKSVMYVHVHERQEGQNVYPPYWLTTQGIRLGYVPEDRLQDDDGEAWFLINRKTRTLSISSTFITMVSMPNGSQITVSYVYRGTQISTIEKNNDSIETYGRTIARTFYFEDEEVASDADQKKFALDVLAQDAFGRETVKFDVAEYGLRAGKLLKFDVGEVDVGGTVRIQTETSDSLTQEQGAPEDSLLAESDDQSRDFIIQQVAYRAVMTGEGWLLVCQVTAGAYQNTLIEALQRLSGGRLEGSSGRVPNQGYPGSLGEISRDLGEVLAGRVTMTDGGDAPFAWDASNFNDHTGVVVGLDDSGTALRGSFLLLEGGVIRVKIGDLSGMTALNNQNPEGWGLWTSHGIFSGTVNASTVLGGTVTGAKIQTTDGDVTVTDLQGIVLEQQPTTNVGRSTGNMSTDYDVIRDANAVSWVIGTIEDPLDPKTGYVTSLVENQIETGTTPLAGDTNVTYLFAGTATRLPGNNPDGIPGLARVIARHTNGEVSYVNVGLGKVEISPRGSDIDSGTVEVYGERVNVHANLFVNDPHTATFEHFSTIGTANLGTSATDTIVFNGKVAGTIVPHLDGATPATPYVDLGTTANRWKKLWVKDVDTETLTVTGSATIAELGFTNLTVSGTASFAGHVTADGSFTVSKGPPYYDQTLTVAGASNLTGLVTASAGLKTGRVWLLGMDTHGFELNLFAGHADPNTFSFSPTATEGDIYFCDTKHSGKFLFRHDGSGSSPNDNPWVGEL